MCGIGLIVSGVAIEIHNCFSSFTTASPGASSQPVSQAVEPAHPNVEDLCGALKRRGPDHIGGAILHVGLHEQHLRVWEGEILDTALNGGSRDGQRSKFGTWHKDDEAVNCRLERVVLSSTNEAARPSLPILSSSARLDFIGATLQLRGEDPVTQPLEDSAGNLLIYNGEIFGGLVVRANENDAAVLLATLSSCCGCACHSSHLVFQCSCADVECHQSVPEVLSKLRGPWALIYWQAASQTLWFGRDAIGRRSLLIHLPSASDTRLLLTSVAPDVREDQPGSFEYWEDLACGIYSFAFSAKDEGASQNGAEDSFKIPSNSVGEGTNQGSRQDTITGWAREHSWEDPRLRTLLAWERQHVTPNTICTSESFKSDQFSNSEQEDVRFVSSDGGRESHGLPLQRNECESEARKDCQLNDSNRQIQKISRHKDPVEQVLAVLHQAVKRRTIQIRQHWGRSQSSEGKSASSKLNSARQATAPIAVLFSGGLDSMILAALACQFVDLHCTIDLINVSFDGDSAPDRITAVAGVAELQRVFPSRRWRLIEVDAKWSDLQKYRVHLQSLICPSHTYMDLNIGTALWLAASGKGHVRYAPASDVAARTSAVMEEELGSDSRTQDSRLILREGPGASTEEDHNTGDKEEHNEYESEARVLLVGSGADEQCGGYGRHRTKFRLGGWKALEAEMRLDFHRIWKRNLGRDDRCIADLGKEARFPFLDEDVISTLLSIPLRDVVDLQEPGGVGDKKILRQVAQALGLKGAASLPKRAIQFGSRIAQASNCRDFGSNRAANQASAGSATLKLK